MTKDQKSILKQMRYAGKSYSDICRALDIKESTIRTFCSRNSLTDNDIKLSVQESKTGVCPNCGKQIKQISKQKPKRFCSDTCRLTWWSNNRVLSEHRAYYKICCKNCGEEFESYGNKSRKYCSHECYIRDRFGNTSGNHQSNKDRSRKEVSHFIDNNSEYAEEWAAYIERSHHN